MTISEVAKNALKVILKESNFDFEKLTENPEAAAADYKAILTAVEQKKYTPELKQALVKIATKSIHEKADTVLNSCRSSKPEKNST